MIDGNNRAHLFKTSSNYDYICDLYLKEQMGLQLRADWRIQKILRDRLLALTSA